MKTFRKMSSVKMWRVCKFYIVSYKKMKEVHKKLKWKRSEVNLEITFVCAYVWLFVCPKTPSKWDNDWISVIKTRRQETYVRLTSFIFNILKNINIYKDYVLVIQVWERKNIAIACPTYDLSYVFTVDNAELLVCMLMLL